MHRYFLEIAYKGTRYSGFQIQKNAITIQSEVEKALQIFFKQNIPLTGSSRTDAGVHAKQNFFHFNCNREITTTDIYHLNAILPTDITVKAIVEVTSQAHCRFSAIYRVYEYYLYQTKDPFKEDRAWYYPYTFDNNLLNEAAEVLMQYQNFASFSKRNTQVNNYICHIQHSQWSEREGMMVYSVKANRFLRGMVRGLVGTMLQVARHKITIENFKQIIESGDASKANFATPAHGLFLAEVNFPQDIFFCN